MESAWNFIDQLIAENALHRKGFRLQEIDPPFVLGQACQELKELCDEPNNPDEMADLFGVLIHYCIKQGWTIDFIETCVMRKLKLRFKRGCDDP
jgi:hypothetical protein